MVYVSALMVVVLGIKSTDKTPFAIPEGGSLDFPSENWTLNFLADGLEAGMALLERLFFIQYRKHRSIGDILRPAR